MPTTVPRACSIKMPHTLRPRTRTSLGHLILACRPVICSMVSHTEWAAEAGRAGPGPAMLAATGRLLIREKNDPVIGLILGQRGGLRVGAVDLVEHQHAPAQTARIQLPFFPGTMSHYQESPCLETVALS